MKINVEADVFDDPDYCRDEKHECYFLEEFACRLYRTIIECGYKKCEPCKKAYKEAMK